jgi:hypothetical protein
MDWDLRPRPERFGLEGFFFYLHGRTGRCRSRTEVEEGHVMRNRDCIFSCRGVTVPAANDLIRVDG